MKLLLIAARFVLPVGLVGALTGLLLTSPSASESSRIDGFGIEMSALPALTIENVEPILDQVEAAGIQYIRQEINWSLIEASPDSYDWASVGQLDLLFSSAKSRGIQVVATLIGGPVYLAGDGGVDKAAFGPRWENFVQAAVNHYGESVDIWEIGSVVNSSQGMSAFLSPLSPQDWMDPDPVFYTDLVRSAAKIINDADPNDQVWLGSLVGVYADDCAMNPLTFLLEVNAARGWKAVDVVSYQPAQGASAPEYPASGEINEACGSNLMTIPNSMSEEVQRIQELARQLGGKEVLVSGLGWSGGDLESLADGRDISIQQVEADMLGRASVILMARNSIPAVFWRTDITENPSSYNAIKNLQNTLSKSRPLGQSQGMEGSIHEYRFGEGGKTVIVAWNTVDGDDAVPASLSVEHFKRLEAWAIDTPDITHEYALQIKVDDAGTAIVLLNERPVIFTGRTSDIAESVRASIHDQVELWGEEVQESLAHVANNLKSEMMGLLEQWFDQAKEEAINWGEEKLDELLP